CAAAPPAGWKPAASALAGESNQISAVVPAYQREPGTWYFIEFLLPLTSNPSGASPDSSGACEPGNSASEFSAATSAACSEPTSGACSSAGISSAATSSAVVSAGVSTGAAGAGAAFSVARSASATVALVATGSITSSMTAMGALSPLRLPIF